MSLSLQGIHVRYPGTQVLRGVNLEVGAGEMIGVVGLSGAGKSTLLRIAILQQTPTRGQVLLGGSPVTTAAPRAVRARFGIVPQEARQSVDHRLDLAATIAAPLSFHDGSWRPRPARHRATIEALAQRVDLDPLLLRRRPDQASDGQLQRVLLARAVATRPDILVCDEPTAALDAASAATVMNVLAEEASRGAAVLVASHDRARLAGAGARIVHLTGGRLSTS